MNRGPETLAEIAARMGGAPPTVADMLAERARLLPDAVVFRFLRQPGPDEELTYGGLDRRAGALAQALVERTEVGDRALLLFPPGLEFIAAFLGCQRAGIVPVPFPLPRAREPAERLATLIENCTPALILTNRESAAGLEARALGPPVLAMNGAAETALPPVALRRTELAFLQYTSGSTGTPRGVMVSHANVLANVREIAANFGATSRSRGVSWLPAYHDMGLIGSLLTPIMVGGTSVLMAPAAFLRDPLSWLFALSSHGADISGGPNLAYELCARRLAEGTPGAALDELDLSSWRVAFIGAEPVRAATLARFAAAAAPYGFRPDSFLPCYGLAEGTLYVDGVMGAPARLTRGFDAAALSRGVASPVSRQAAQPPVRRIELVACGDRTRPSETRVLIVDPDGARPLPDGQVGEICVSGPGIASGYWHRRPETEAAFHNTIEGETGRFLRTGDLGFLHDGRLFISGRRDDVILINGANHHPEDIENAIASELPELPHGRAAVFAVEDGPSVRIVAAQEVPRDGRRSLDLDRFANAIRTAAWNRQGVAIAEVIPLRPGTLPLTSSGKVQRRRCRELYLSGELEAWRWAPAARPSPAGSAAQTEREPPAGLRIFRAILAEVLSRPPEEIDVHQPISALGLDSLKTVEVQLLADSRLAWDITGELLHGDLTVTQVAERRGEAGTSAAAAFWMDAALAADLVPPPGVPAFEGEALVTGATGLVGARIVRELLERTDMTVHCLVRAAAGKDPAARLRERLVRCGAAARSIDDRIRVIVGDAGAPFFGLSEEAFANLAAHVGVVVHGAAELDFIRPYAALRATNIDAARTVLALASRGRPKIVLHVSSISVLETPARAAAALAEDAALDFPETLAVGYARSKWVADVLMTRARERGFAVAVFRPSWIVGDGEAGGEFLERFLAGCRRLGGVPDSAYRWDIVSADYVARAIVTLARAKNPSGVYHLGAARPQSVRQLTALLRRCGLPLRVVPADAWRQRLRDSLASDPDNPLRPLAPLFLRSGSAAAAADSYMLGRMPTMDSRRTRSRLRRLGVPDSRVDDALLRPLVRAIQVPPLVTAAD